jgi:hypothetical protein
MRIFTCTTGCRRCCSRRLALASFAGRLRYRQLAHGESGLRGPHNHGPGQRTTFGM